MSQTSKKQTVCTICSKTFAYHCYYRRHVMLAHDKIRNYLCQVCGKSFLHKTHLGIHLQIHDNVKTHSCQECGKSFIEKNKLDRHMRTHSGDKPYVCTLCFKTFGYLHSYKRHVQIIHQNIRNHLCQLCGKRFIQKSDLRKHQIIHSDEDPHVYPDCPTTSECDKRIEPMNGGNRLLDTMNLRESNICELEDAPQPSDRDIRVLKTTWSREGKSLDAENLSPSHIPKEKDENRESPSTSDQRTQMSENIIKTENHGDSDDDNMDADDTREEERASTSPKTDENDRKSHDDSPEINGDQSNSHAAQETPENLSRNIMVGMLPPRIEFPQCPRASDRTLDNAFKDTGSFSISRLSAPSNLSSHMVNNALSSGRMMPSLRPPIPDPYMSNIFNSFYLQNPARASPPETCICQHRAYCYKCDYCEILFKDNVMYLVHMGLHSSSNPLKCSMCRETFQNCFTFFAHTLKH